MNKEETARVRSRLRELVEQVDKLKKDKMEMIEASDRYFEGFSSAIGVIHFYLRKYPDEKRARNWLEDYVSDHYKEIQKKSRWK